MQLQIDRYSALKETALSVMFQEKIQDIKLLSEKLLQSLHGLKVSDIIDLKIENYQVMLEK
jgi:hypothetical protein